MNFAHIILYSCFWSLHFETNTDNIWKKTLLFVVNNWSFFPRWWKVQGFHEARGTFGKVQSYSGMLNCFKVVAKEEGVAGFFKGLAPSTLKVRTSRVRHDHLETYLVRLILWHQRHPFSVLTRLLWTSYARNTCACFVSTLIMSLLTSLSINILRKVHMMWFNQDFQIKPAPDASHRLLQAFAPGTFLYFEIRFLKKKSEKLNNAVLLNISNFEVRATFGGHSAAIWTYHMSFLCMCTSVLVQFPQWSGGSKSSCPFFFTVDKLLRQTGNNNFRN